MPLHKVSNIMIGDGSAMPAANLALTVANIADGDLAVIKDDMTTAGPGLTVSDSQKIWIAAGTSETAGQGRPIRLSIPIEGKKITGYLAKSYTAPKREVWVIGYNRKTLAGSITVTNSVDYDFSITFRKDSGAYAERNLRIGKTITSDSTATQLEIAAAITNAINNDATLTKYVTARLVGNGTIRSVVAASGTTPAIYSGTGATAYGVEIFSKELTQFSTSYFEDRVSFEVNIDDASGFGSASTCTQIQAMEYGTGTYRQVYNMENFMYQYEGVLNRTEFPIPTLNYESSNTFYDSAAITQTATYTTNHDAFDISASQTAIVAGDKVVIGTVNAEILYIMDTGTEAVLVDTHTAAGGTGFKKRMQYDLITIEFEKDNLTPGANALTNSQQTVTLAIPAIASAGAYNAQSAQLADMLGVLNPYLNSVGFASVNP